MKLRKPKFWDEKLPNLTAKLLYPISLVYGFLSNKKNIRQNNNLKIKTICVGNIYLGGTGKSSLAIQIKDMLSETNKKVCFIKKNNNSYLDEINLLKHKGKVYDNKSRLQSLLDANEEGYDYAIFDDGLHEAKIDYDLKIVCFNKKNWIGNGLLLPAGPLRENLQNIKKYDVVFFNGNQEDISDYKKYLVNINTKLLFFESEYHLSNIDELDNKKPYFAFSGIGNHSTFIDMLKNNNLNIVEHEEFPDHYNYTPKELDRIVLNAEEKKINILTTEKDMQRISDIYKKKIQVIRIFLKIKNEFNFSEKLNSL